MKNMEANKMGKQKLDRGTVELIIVKTLQEVEPHLEREFKRRWTAQETYELSIEIWKAVRGDAQ